MESKYWHPVPLRAHHIMCLHAYTGRGYNQDFITRLDYIKDLIYKHPETSIRIISSPDIACEACPNCCNENGCIADGTDDQEIRVSNRDKKVMQLAGIAESEILTAIEAFRRVEMSIDGSMLDEICIDCNWLPNSRCKTMINKDFWISSIE